MTKKVHSSVHYQFYYFADILTVASLRILSFNVKELGRLSSLFGQQGVSFLRVCPHTMHLKY